MSVANILLFHNIFWALEGTLGTLRRYSPERSVVPLEQAPKFQLLLADPRVQVLADAIMDGRTEFLTNMGYAYGNPFARAITFHYEGILITFRNHGIGKRLWTNRGGYFEVVICDDRGEGDFTVFYYTVYARK